MTISSSTACPECRANGHDKGGDHLLIFEDGGMFCPHADYHKSGETYYIKKGDKNPIFENEIDGKTKYTPDQFRELLNSGKLKKENVRIMALAGMSLENRYEVSTKDERKVIEAGWKRDLAHFDKLKFRNLVTREIEAVYCKLYNVRTGVDKKNRVARHYYPVYSEDNKLIGAKCRNLPKDFRSGSLGHMFGKIKMFGQHTMKQVSKSGARKNVLTICGGEIDAMSIQQMLCDARKAGRFEDTLFHVWSVPSGESGLKAIIDNIKDIRKFKKVIWAFDNDPVGQDLNKRACRLLREQSVVLTYPDGCKDANQCLADEREEEFIDAWWNADVPSVSSIKTMEDLYDEATQEVEMGLSFPWESLTKFTFGIRPHNLYTIGGGSGTGKTEMAKEIIQHLTDHHDEMVGVIFMEERASFTARVLAGKWINKKIHLPKNHMPKGHEDWDKGRDYTTEQANGAIRSLMKKGKILIAACEGDTHIDNIMILAEELRGLGCKYLFVDNLTTISHKGKEGSVKAIDESMKRIGTFMQEHPVSVFLLSHLAKPDQNRTPYEEGGQVRQGDFRGSQSIAFWSTFMIAVERNTQGDKEERCTTYLRIVKDRLTGVSTGETILLRGDTNTGRVLEPNAHSKIREADECSPRNRNKSSKKTKGKKRGKKG